MKRLEKTIHIKGDFNERFTTIVWDSRKFKNIDNYVATLKEGDREGVDFLDMVGESINSLTYIFLFQNRDLEYKRAAVLLLHIYNYRTLQHFFSVQANEVNFNISAGEEDLDNEEMKIKFYKEFDDDLKSALLEFERLLAVYEKVI